MDFVKCFRPVRFLKNLPEPRNFYTSAICDKFHVWLRLSKIELRQVNLAAGHVFLSS